jgi:hypothetical protein
MGLDFSHTEAHWSYGGFDRFRQALAKHEGFNLNEMHGFCAPWRGDDPEAHPNRSWDEIATPLKPLLDHSDCEDDLSPEECAQIAPRLREVIDAIWPEGSDSYDRAHGLMLAEGLELAASEGERFEFC